jgi:transcriptional regulator with XRE-family HTH domain
METPEQRVKRNVRQLRAERSWTLANLSDRLAEIGHPLSVKVLNKLESTSEDHGRGVNVDDLVALSHAFGVPMERLLASSALPETLTTEAERVAKMSEGLERLQAQVARETAALRETQARLEEQTAAATEAQRQLLELADEAGLSKPQLLARLREHGEPWTAEVLKRTLKG